MCQQQQQQQTQTVVSRSPSICLSTARCTPSIPEVFLLRPFYHVCIMDLGQLNTPQCISLQPKCTYVQSRAPEPQVQLLTSRVLQHFWVLLGFGLKGGSTMKMGSFIPPLPKHLFGKEINRMNRGSNENEM